MSNLYGMSDHRIQAGLKVIPTKKYTPEQKVQIWQDGVTRWSGVVSRNPESPGAHNNRSYNCRLTPWDLLC